MEIRYAGGQDLDWLARHDTHIAYIELQRAIQYRRVYLAEEEGNPIGWLRYHLFWDQIPFMNLLYLLEEARGKGFGRQLVTYWEQDMKQQGYSRLLTSTQSNEFAQHFYTRLGYQAIGGFRLEHEPYELIFEKIWSGGESHALLSNANGSGN